jgi:hypothetical protein
MEQTYDQKIYNWMQKVLAEASRQQETRENEKIHERSIQRSLNRMVKLGLIVEKSPGVYGLNPRYSEEEYHLLDVIVLKE